ncbi:MAG: four helix bundle protein [Candidatus Omnitrophica bacterium]|nr:four helix bundle protein [Candidatus Omnitrophota bacterium]
MPQSYEDLEVYQLSKKLAVDIHQITLTHLPQYEKYETGSQIRRAAKSIGANIVEGFGRKKYKTDYVRFLTYALASCDETKYHLEMLFLTGALEQAEYSSLLERFKTLGKKLYSFRKSITNSYVSDNSVASYGLCLPVT